jgi:hypothetical protein
MQITAAGAAVVAIALLGLPSAVQDPQDPKSANRFVIEAGEHSIKDLIERAAAALKRNYVYSEAELAQIAGPESSVRIQNRLDLGLADVEQVVSQLVFTRGFVMLPVNPERGIYEWINMTGMKRAEIDNRATQMTADEVLAWRGAKIPVFTGYTLETINAQQATNTLRPFFVSAGATGAMPLAFATVGDSRTLLIRGLSDQVVAAIKMLRRVDTAEPDTESFVDWKERIEQRLEALERKLK